MKTKPKQDQKKKGHVGFIFYVFFFAAAAALVCSFRSVSLAGLGWSARTRDLGRQMPPSPRRTAETGLPTKRTTPDSGLGTWHAGRVKLRRRLKAFRVSERLNE